MKIANVWTAVLAGVLVASSTPAIAGGLRCGKRLVSKGDSTYRVRAVCGEPSDVTQRSEIRLRGQVVEALCPELEGRENCIAAFDEHVSEIQIDEWIYDFGSNRLLQRLTFEQGVLNRVDSIGARGIAR